MLETRAFTRLFLFADRLTQTVERQAVRQPWRRWLRCATVARARISISGSLSHSFSLTSFWPLLRKSLGSDRYSSKRECGNQLRGYADTELKTNCQICSNQVCNVKISAILAVRSFALSR
jgi:hypothetical protein